MWQVQHSVQLSVSQPRCHGTFVFSNLDSSQCVQFQAVYITQICYYFLIKNDLFRSNKQML